MKTIRRAAWSCLLLAVTCGCATKKMEIHYVQVEACQTWSDQDNPAVVYPTPLVVFRLVSVTNTSAPGTPNIIFDLYNLYFNGDTREHPEISSGIPSFGDIGLQLVPGQSVHFPQGRTRALFAIQPFFGRTEDVQGEVFYLNYESASDESVFVVRDPSPWTFHLYCGKTALSALQ